MLIRHQADHLRLITQEHHALISGLLAQQWRGLAGTPRRVAPLTSLAIGLHDNAWRIADTVPRLDREVGRPHDFLSFPLDDKIGFYREGIMALEAVHPYVALLVSRHYTAFPGTRDAAGLQRSEADRQTRLTEELPEVLAAPERQDLDLRYMQLFDVLSIYLSLTGPDVDPAGVPPWLADPSVFAWDPAVEDAGFDLGWDGPARLLANPFPFHASFALELYWREIPRGPYPDQADLDGAWIEARRGRRIIEVAPG